MTNIDGYCKYSTPCGWCTKWDKECNKKIGDSGYNSEDDKIYICSDCIHEGNFDICGHCISSVGEKPSNFEYHY